MMTLKRFRIAIFRKYKSAWSHSKMLTFARASLKYLTKTRLDTRYIALEVFLDGVKALKERKNVTSRIITKKGKKDNGKTVIKGERPCRNCRTFSLPTFLKLFISAGS